MRMMGTPALLQSVGLNALPFTKWQTAPNGVLGRLTSASPPVPSCLLNLRLQLAEGFQDFARRAVRQPRRGNGTYFVETRIQNKSPAPAGRHMCAWERT